MTTIEDEQFRAIPPGPVKCLCVIWHRPTPTELHRHHVLPLAKPWSGPDATSNLVWLCLPPRSPVLMADGTRQPIERVHPGSVVIGHDLRPHMVTAQVATRFRGDLVVLNGRAMTPDHPVMTPAGWASAGRLRVGDAVLLAAPEVCGDDLAADAKLAPDGTEADALVAASDDVGVIDVAAPAVVLAATRPSRVLMQQVVAVGADDAEVLDPVVVADLVDMVNDLIGGQAAAQVLLHDPAVLKHGAPLAMHPHDDVPIPLRVKPPSALTLLGARDALEGHQTTGVAAELLSLADCPVTGEHGLEGRVTLGAGAGSRPVERAALPDARAFAGTGHVARRKVGGASERLPALDARLLDQREVPALLRRWGAVTHVEARPFDGVVWDISVADSSSFITDDLVVHNCPTSHSNVHELLRAYLTNHGRPPADAVAPFGRYVRKLAARAWAEHTGKRMQDY